MQSCLYVQIVYYFLSGLWPVISSRSFQKITGPKKDIFLVKTVGLLVMVISLTLWLALEKKSFESFTLLGAGSAAALAAIDIVYAAQKVLLPVYLLDAALEIAFIIIIFLNFGSYFW